MKTDDKLDQNWPGGYLDDAMHAIRCSGGHSLRLILRKLGLLCTFILAALLYRRDAIDMMV